MRLDIKALFKLQTVIQMRASTIARIYPLASFDLHDRLERTRTPCSSHRASQSSIPVIEPVRYAGNHEEL